MTILKLIVECQERVSSPETFKCESDPNCKSKPDYIVFTKSGTVHATCFRHKDLDDAIARWFNTVWRTWEMPSDTP